MIHAIRNLFNLLNPLNKHIRFEMKPIFSIDFLIFLFNFTSKTFMKMKERKKQNNEMCSNRKTKVKMHHRYAGKENKRSYLFLCKFN